MSRYEEGPSEAAERYLIVLHELAVAGAPTTFAEVARHLGVRAISASGMLRRLADQGLVTMALGSGVLLTPQGRAVAVEALRRRKLIAAYLVAHLGYGQQHAAAEAERLRHDASPELLARMEKAVDDV